MNASYPALQLRRSDVIYANCGLVPFGDSRNANGELSFGKESRITDHRSQGIDGLVTLIGIRYTTARGDAARALDLLLKQMPNAPGRSPTQSTPLAGGDIQDFAALGAAAQRELDGTVTAPTLKAWLRNYGTDYKALAQLSTRPGQTVRIGNSDTLTAEVTHAVQNEMALKLSDVILRRTNLGSGAHPGSEALADAAAVMQPLLAWTDAKRREELAATENSLRDHRASVPAAELRPRVAQSAVLS
jgi:glycerol-3-phosphate dehydrogenase